MDEKMKSEKEILELALKQAFNPEGCLVSQCKTCEAWSQESEEDCIYTNIFSHEFAKAFWGEDWLFHLIEMVKEEQPIRYVEKFLK
jgi:hypothetical protein